LPKRRGRGLTIKIPCKLPGRDQLVKYKKELVQPKRASATGNFLSRKRDGGGEREREGLRERERGGEREREGVTERGRA
jgi:hypothetical protein